MPELAHELEAAVAKSAEDGTIGNAAAVHAPAWELNPSLDSEERRESKRRLLGVDGFDQEHASMPPVCGRRPIAGSQVATPRPRSFWYV